MNLDKGDEVLFVIISWVFYRFEIVKTKSWEEGNLPHPQGPGTPRYDVRFPLLRAQRLAFLFSLRIYFCFFISCLYFIYLFGCCLSVCLGSAGAGVDLLSSCLCPTTLHKGWHSVISMNEQTNERKNVDGAEQTQTRNVDGEVRNGLDPGRCLKVNEPEAVLALLSAFPPFPL